MVTDAASALLQLPDAPPTRSEAMAYCRALARTHYENFTVLSWLAPRPMRLHLAILYAYCRTVDDIGDKAEGDRLDLLDRYEGELDAAYAGTARHPVLVALQETIEQHELPREPLVRLIDANRRDQRTHRYPTFDHLLEYCAYSANPVGQLVLALHGIRDRESVRLSDATCTALQLANFWQDVKRDAAMGRIYLPQDEMKTFGVQEQDLAADTATASFTRLMAFQVNRARRYFASGLPLIDRVTGHLRIDLALFSRGGLAILDKIEAQGFDTLQTRPEVSTFEKFRLLVSSIFSTRWRQWI